MKKNFKNAFGFVTGLYAGLLAVDLVSKFIDSKTEKDDKKDISEKDFVQEEGAH